MKHLMISCIAVVLLTSCQVNEDDYYNPPPRVEVNPNYYPHRHYHGHPEYRPAPSGNNYHGHVSQGGNAGVINSQQQVHVAPANNQQNIHGHEDNKEDSVVHKHPAAAAEDDVQANVHGH